MKTTLLLCFRFKNKEARAWFEDYEKRLKRSVSLEVLTVKCPADRALEESVLKPYAAKGSLYLLDETGKTYSTKLWAQWLREQEREEKHVLFVVGPPSGFSLGARKLAKGLLSLSAFTLAHELAAVTLIEQLYRCHDYLKGGPYHRETPGA